MKKPLGRLAGAALAGAVLTLALAPAASAQTGDPSSSPATTSDSPTAVPTETSSASETPSTSVTPTSGTPAPPAASAPQTHGEKQQVKTTEATTSTTPPEKPYQDNVGHGYVNLSGEGVLVIACASGAPSDVATANLSVVAGPDQDEADGRYWNYDVRVVGAVPGATASFSWTCDKVAGQGEIEFEQAPPEQTSTPEPTPSTPATTSTTTTPPGTSAATPSTTTGTTADTTADTTAATGPVQTGGTQPRAQVRYAPKGGVETGFGGTARF
ncbi:hypothetical protein [Amycolatopsis sp. H20-H5]|uniref:hypothetical protein n=1 Tax=Amycolatopsis sp. H20-H5 TaxID=3046309 RepID=UPI002DBBACB9|nr:hypothetical protein [Amycolatopsis sp. H20-H5]MEC3980936.1 hypothetical protein [Amycolatopsis sp. H20-H5]